MEFYCFFPIFAFLLAAVPSGLEQVDRNPSQIQAVSKKKQISNNITFWRPNHRSMEFSSPEWVSIGNIYEYDCRSVSLSQDGRTVARGCPYYNNSQGRVFIHSLINNEWVEQKVFYGQDPYDSFGYSVSLSEDGSTVSIGAYGTDGNGSDSGLVQVYRNLNGSWTHLIGEAQYDYSGRSVSLSKDGNTVAIGATGNDGNGSNSGHVRVYKYSDNGSWTQIGLDLDGEASYDKSGWSVSLSGDGRTVAIGAYRNDGNGYCNYFGWSVSLSGDASAVAIGADYNDGNGSFSGHVRVYKFSSSNNAWTQIGTDLDGEAQYDYSGGSVSLSKDGSTVAIGATGNDGNGSNSGHVRVYRYSNSNNAWTQLGNDIDGTSANVYFGRSVSLSEDGKTLAAIDRYYTNIYNLLNPSSSPSIIPSEIPSTSPSTSQMPSLTPSSSPSSIPSKVPSLSPSFNPSSKPSNGVTLGEDQTEVTIEASTTLSTGNANNRRVDLAITDGDAASQVKEIFEATLLTMFDVDAVEVTNVVCYTTSCDVDFIMTKIVECEGTCTEDSIATLQNSFEQSMANELVTAIEDGTFTDTFVASAESAGYNELTDVTGFTTPDFEFDLTISPTMAPTISTSTPIIPPLLVALIPFVVGIVIAVITIVAVSSIGFFYWWWRLLPLPNNEGP